MNYSIQTKPNRIHSRKATLAWLLGLCCAAGLLAPGIAFSQGTCTHAPAGLVGWWKAENNAGDTLGNHNGSLQGGLGFGSGQVGQAFNFTAPGQEVRVPASSSINVGAGGGYTTEGWINPLNVTTQNPIFEWNDGVTAGAHLWIAVSFAGLGGPGSLYASLIAGTTNTTVATGPGVIRAGVWQHVAFAYDRASGMGRLYLNGTEVASRALGNITAQTALPLRIGRRPNFGAETFAGKIDELSLYNRALSSAEVQAIYNAGSGGKSPLLVAGSVAWGDYDNDGRLDLLLAGLDGEGGVIQLWHNDGNGCFTQLLVPGLPRVTLTSLAWGDYDNDGRLDFLVTGSGGSESSVSQLWNNRGNGGFAQAPVPGMPGVAVGSVAWADYDDDGYLDFLLTGATNISPSSFSSVSQLWHNNGNGTFSNVTSVAAPGLPGVALSSVAWGDYDNDGRRDFLLTGYTDTGRASQLWHNNGNGTFSNVTSVAAPGLPEVGFSSVAWGDYDNDGWLDFLIAGSSNTGRVSQLWHNNGNGTFSNVTSVAAPGLPGVSDGAVAWGDYDNDGRLDFLITGYTSPGRVSQLWHNNGNGTFSNTTSVAAPGLPGFDYSSVAWGDYDNDGRLDFLLAGNDGTHDVIRLWHNQTVAPNKSPSPPGDLTMVITNGAVILNWSAASDPETPAAGLTYNLRMGTSPGGSDVVSPQAAFNGFRRLPAMGNRQQTRSASIRFLLDQPLYWSVQAVDSAFAGSAFAPEQGGKIGDLNGDGVVDQSELNAVLANYWPNSPWLQMTNAQKLPDGRFQFALTNASAWNFSVEASTNFLDWNFLGPAYPVYQFLDPEGTNAPMRFYRLRWP